MRHFRLFILLPCLLAFQTIIAQHTVTFGVVLSEVTDTEKVYDFFLEDFEQIIGWQFTMNFDGDKMSFKEVRNPIIDGLNNSCFYEPNPGDLISVWLDLDLVPTNYSDSIVAFQLVFDLLDGDGSNLCFELNQEYYEFIVDDDMGNFYYSELIIYDECNDGQSIFLETTATEGVSHSSEVLKDVYLEASGTFSFYTDTKEPMQLSLYSIDGKLVQVLEYETYTQGRHSLQLSAMMPGTYLLHAITENGQRQTIKTAVR